jgi:glutathione peroxidase
MKRRAPLPRYPRTMKPVHLLTAALLSVSFPALAGSLYDIPLKTLDGKDATLKEHEGKVMLIVNVASRCGNTKQYTELQKLHEDFAKDGLAVLGFPCNDFGKQEPGTAEEIKTFCTTKYNVTFPMYEKLVVKGPDKHPLYQELSGEKSPFPGDVKWNFGKFLVDKKGRIIARFEPKTRPDAPEVMEAIKKALK